MLNLPLIYYNFKTNFYPGLEHNGNWDHSVWWKLFWAGFNFHCSVPFTLLKVNKAIHISKPHSDDSQIVYRQNTEIIYNCVWNKQTYFYCSLKGLIVCVLFQSTCVYMYCTHHSNVTVYMYDSFVCTIFVQFWKDKLFNTKHNPILSSDTNNSSVEKYRTVNLFSLSPVISISSTTHFTCKSE